MGQASMWVLAVALAAAPLVARADGLTGTWVGSYDCAQGSTGLTLTIRALRPRALFHFYALDSNPAVPEGCFWMDAAPGARPNHVTWQAGSWIEQPPGYVTVDLDADIVGDTMTGTVAGPGCTRFTVHRTASRGDSPAACHRGAVVAGN